MLRFQTESRPPLVLDATFTLDRSVQKIGRIKLHAWFRGKHRKLSTRARLVDAGRFGQVSGFAVQHEIVVVSVSQAHLLVTGIDALSYACTLAKIEWSARHSP